MNQSVGCSLGTLHVYRQAAMMLIKKITLQKEKYCRENMHRNLCITHYHLAFAPVFEFGDNEWFGRVFIYYRHMILF